MYGILILFSTQVSQLFTDAYLEATHPLAITYGLAPYTLLGTHFLAEKLQTFWIRLPYWSEVFLFLSQLPSQS